VGRGLALLVAGCFFMEILDATIVTPAAPAIAADLGVPAVSVNIAITAYVVTLAVLIPVSGWLSDRYGARLVLGAAIAVFTAASVGCAFAGDLTVLTLMRVLQGAGGAMMVPVGRLVVLRTTAKSDLLRAMAYLTWPALVAPVVAPTLGGLLSTYASWRWIFLVNVPLGLVAFVLARRLVPEVRDPDVARLDWRGAVLVAVGAAALVLGLDGMGADDPRWMVVGGALTTACVVLAAAVRHLLFAARPLLDLRVLSIATYRVSAFSGSCFRAVITAVPFLLALFLQLGLGWNAAQAGLLMTPLFVGNLAIKPATTPLLRRWGIRRVMVASVAGSVVCLVGITALRESTPLLVLVAVVGLSGVFRSIGFTTFNSVAFADVEPGRMTYANTLMSTMQELAGGLGIAVGALLVHLGDAVVDGPSAGFRVAFGSLAVLLLLPAVGAWRLHPTAGEQVTTR
jgi:EmrB/QacA subfamily drug resistance transporter